MTAQTVAALSTAIVSIVGAITAAIVAIQSHGKTAQAVISAANIQPQGQAQPQTTAVQPNPFTQPSQLQGKAS